MITPKSLSLLPAQTPSPMVYGSQILIATSAAVGIVGVVTNGLALVVIFAFTTIWKKINFFLLVNQIAVDFATCVIIAFQYLTITSGDPIASFFQIKLTNQDACRWWYAKAWMWGMILSSNYNVVMVTIERYLKIVHPVVYRNNMTWVRFV